MYQKISEVRGVYHEKNHDEDDVDLCDVIFTNSQGFLGNGPGASVDKVPVEYSCPYTYISYQGPSIKLFP